jgi:hypothetical protein
MKKPILDRLQKKSMGGCLVENIPRTGGGSIRFGFWFWNLLLGRNSQHCAPHSAVSKTRWCTGQSGLGVDTSLQFVHKHL